MAEHYIHRNDLLQPIIAKLKRGNGAWPLIGASSVEFHMRDSAGTVKINAAASIDDAANGVVSYAWQSGDTDTAGTFFGEFQVNWPGSKPETFPARPAYIRIHILPEIA